MPLQNLNKNYDKTNKYAAGIQNITKMQSPYQNIQMATTVYKPVHETTETANYGKATGTIKGSYLMHADEHTKVFMDKIEKLGLCIQKFWEIIKGKL